MLRTLLNTLKAVTGCFPDDVKVTMVFVSFVFLKGMEIRRRLVQHVRPAEVMGGGPTRFAR